MDNKSIDNQAFDGLLEKLKAEKWPSKYVFKCIVPTAQSGTLSEVKNQFDGLKSEMSVKHSKTKKYISLTVVCKRMVSAQSVIDVYQNLAKIEGVITL
ncbi:MAG: DUF493 family protein [Flavobacteriales bacterium]